MNHRPGNLCLAFLAGIPVMGWAAVEDWFGRFDYAGDAIAYLDIAKAVSRGDWSLAFSPYWSIGYPLIISATRWMFPPGPQGEWMAIHVVNLVIFLVTYLSFLYFLKIAAIYTAEANGAKTASSESGFIFVIGTSIFLLWQLLIGNVSRVSPDLLVSGVFFLITALSLQFVMRPQVKTAILMGLLMGLGYLLKAAFLPLSAVVILVVLLHNLTRLPADRRPAVVRLAWFFPAMALLAAPYIAANSRALDSFTLGESASLNYAWSVNHLPSWTHWQGGPLSCGAPMHPPQLVLRNPPVFTFAEPFHVTYPPWFNPFYWYEGYHHGFSIRNQLSALKNNLGLFLQLFFNGPHLLAKAFASVALCAAALFLLSGWKTWWKRLLALWPLYVPSIAAIGMYLMVAIQPRYVVGFLILLLATPFLPLFVPTRLCSRKIGYAVVILVLLGSAAILLKNERTLLHRAIHDQPYTSDEQWQVGLYLAESGIHPGDQVASVTVGGAMLCTWARVGEVHIVGEIGNEAFDPRDQEKDFRLFVGNPAVQQTAFELFRQAGARMVIALDVDGRIQGPGWQRIPGTRTWLHRLDEAAP
ncbi:MAG: hypothetical protein LV480_06400 [Methylacidiphilales bacterium]|nr:hypothetical protein [Candidatus Methylacidiphilales bacterium]